ncbi:hypothetical protein A3K63_03540 [Candidatus Micrarchaeota archaeon RBG_16_49_10]|nr:MAG: hypothetical protein A3K63_03540 [Candidatus Micrarchaeota archaeon RBG_16_49_10]
MVSREEHLRAIREFEQDIEEKIKKGVIAERQRIIGFSLTECAKNYFELYLHKMKLVNEGMNINHRWFSSERMAMDKFPFDFPHKREILKRMVLLENKRNLLCYGKAKPKREIEDALKLFSEIKKIIKKEIGE